MEFISTPFEGLFIIKPLRFGDSRGYFCETFKQEEFDRAVGRHVEFVQDNESFSSFGVVRGLHFQRGDAAQAKLVRVSQGMVLDVALDLRPHSPTFGKHFAAELSADNGLQMFVPRGFAHGFAVLSPVAQFQYKVDNVYCPAAEGAIRFDDCTLGINWRIAPENRILSQKDLAAPTFATYLKEN